MLILILIFLSTVYEYAYFYEYIWKMVYWSRKIIPENFLEVFSAIARNLKAKCYQRIYSPYSHITVLSACSIIGFCSVLKLSALQ